MKFNLKLMVAALLMSAATLAFGQGATNSAMRGTVSDQSGEALPGAVVTATHEPTGTRYETVTRENGNFQIFNMRTGGPYTVTVSMTGFRAQTKSDIFLKLGETLNLEFSMQLDSVEETLVVVAESNPIINPDVTGAVTQVSAETIAEMPTINREISDIARMSPYATETSSDADPTAISVAGRSNRYNNILIDGAVNNDLFGLAASGTPGGQADAQPISLDAIQEFQLLVAPYDVRQGGFSGGGFNAITRSGSNSYEGSVYYYTADDSLVGELNNTDVGTFGKDDYGFRFGGPLVKDKAFFFVNAEISERDTPAGISVAAPGNTGDGVPFEGPYEEVLEVYNIARNIYGYTPGGLNPDTGNFDQFTRVTESDKVFVRFDFNINLNHQLTLRHNYVDAVNDVGRPDEDFFLFDDAYYQFESETNSTVLQLNSTFGEFYNEFRVTYQTIRDNRGGPTRFPNVSVELSDGSDVTLGTEAFSTANSLDQDIIEVTNDLTFFRGNHTITVGTHNEFFKFDNLFIRQAFGDYSFDSVEDFRNGWAQSFDYSFSNDPSDPLKSAKYKVNQFGLYIGDQWAVKPNLNITMGLRADLPNIPDEPTANPDVEQIFGYRTDVTPAGDVMWSPRVGFNWDIDNDGKRQLRGGIGIFSGRVPFVWLSNQYSNTGIEFTRISSFLNGDIDEDNHIDFVADPDAQPTNIGSASTNEVNLVTDEFEFPQVLRTNIAYDHDFEWYGLIGTAELMYSKTLNDILYQNINLQDSGEDFVDGRAIYESVDRDFRDVILLKDTNEGYTYNALVQVQRLASEGFTGSVSWMYGRARSINDGTSSQARSNWRFLPSIDPNDPELADSNFDVRHRINANVSYSRKFWGDAKTVFSFFYNVQSGRPFSTTYRRDVNGDFNDNDLIFVYDDPSQVNIIDFDGNNAWNAWAAYVDGDEGLSDARGTIVGRNASRAPWIHQLDFHFAQEIPISRTDLEITFDVKNFLNLLNDDWGRYEWVSFNETSPLRYMGEGDNGLPTFRLEQDLDDRTTTDNLRSRWQARMGVRWTF